MKHALAAPRVRRWARRARAVNPRHSEREESSQLRADLPVVVQRMAMHGAGMTVSPGDLSRPSLTRLQRELRDATEMSPRVAQDAFLQQFRKHLHLLLDH